MPIDRAEVSRIEHNAVVSVGSGMDMWLPPEVIAELCRSYLAVLDAPVADFGGCAHSMKAGGQTEVTYRVLDRSYSAPMRVRLVAVGDVSAEAAGK